MTIWQYLEHKLYELSDINLNKKYYTFVDTFNIHVNLCICTCRLTSVFHMQSGLHMCIWISEVVISIELLGVNSSRFPYPISKHRCNVLELSFFAWPNLLISFQLCHNIYNGIIFPSLNPAKRTPIIGPWTESMWTVQFYRAKPERRHCDVIRLRQNIAK